MLAAWLKGLVATVPFRKWQIGRAVNLSYYSVKPFNPLRLVSRLPAPSLRGGQT